MIEFTVTRISETQFQVSWDSTGEGLQLNYTRDPEETRAWGPPMANLGSWGPELMPAPGTPVAIKLDLLALLTPDGQVAPILPGDKTNFKGISYSVDATGKKVFDTWWPGEPDGTGEPYRHTWEPWPPPEPEPQPEPPPEPEPQPEPPPEPEPLPEPEPPPPGEPLPGSQRVELWRPLPFVPTPWGRFALFIGKELPPGEGGV